MSGVRLDVTIERGDKFAGLAPEINTEVQALDLSILSPAFQHSVTPYSTWEPFATQFYPHIISTLKDIWPWFFDVFWLCIIIGSVTFIISVAESVVFSGGRNEFNV